MATYYIPDSTGWKSTLAKGSGSGHLRIRIDQTYTASTNQSSLTASIEIKSDGTGSGTGYHMQDGGSFKFPASSSSASTVNHNYTLSSLSTSSFTALQTSGSTKYWSVTVTHNADGTATVYASVSGFRLQNSGRTRIWTWDKSGSITLSNTPSYTLSLSVGVHSGGTVKRDGTALSNGATINRGDTLVFDYAPDPGYSIGTHTVNGTARSSGYSWTVTGAATVITTATVISNTLTVSAGTGTTITVNRQSSPLGGASTGVITSGATVYYNDTLEVTFTANTGYILATHTIQGVTRDSGYVYTVKENPVSVVATAALIEFLLTITKTTGAQVVVSRTSSPIGAAPTGVLTDGSTLYTNDVLTIAINADSGYVITTATLNNQSIESPHTVLDNVTIIVVAAEAGPSFAEKLVAIVYNNNNYFLYTPLIFDGTTWKEYIPYRYIETE